MKGILNIQTIHSVPYVLLRSITTEILSDNAMNLTFTLQRLIEWRNSKKTY